MTRWMLCLIAIHCFAAPLIVANDRDQHDGAESNWPQWRGPLGTGVAPNADPAVEWSETKDARWKVAVPGKGHATPIG